MNNRLCFLCCQNFQPEITAAIAAEGWADVAVAAFPARCGRPPLGWDELHTLVPEECRQTVILGNACLRDLRQPPQDWPAVRVLAKPQCFQLIAGETLTEEAIARGAYLISPAWLDNWRAQLAHMGFDEKNAADFFQESSRELVLLDTGIYPDAPAKLAELSQALGLPASRVAVGLDYVRPYLARLVAEWRLEEERCRGRARAQDHARQLADYVSAMDFLGRLAQPKDEQGTLAAIEDVFRMLFAPQDYHYVRHENGAAQCVDVLPPELAAQVSAMERDWAWSASGTGFLVRIARAGETLGIISVDKFAFPEFREHYLNLALSVAGVCGLAIENARAFQRIKEAEAALQAFNVTLEQRVAEEVAKNLKHERMLIHQSRLAAMGEMISYIAHQWRQPLNTLGILAANLKDDYEFQALTPEVMEKYAGQINSLLQRMSATIDDFRDFFKPGKEKTVFSVESVVQDVLNLLGANLAQHNIEVRQDIPENMTIAGFPNEFAQVVLNIVTNAREAITTSGRHDGLIRIRGECSAGRAVLSVQNNGDPIPENILPNIFEAYFTTKTSGSGIGLYMSRVIVETHLDGKIEARNLPDGAEFIIDCPLAAAP